MKSLRIFSLVAIIVILGCHDAAGGVKVIANLSVQADSMTVAELKGIFLGETRSLSDGSHVEPVLVKNGSAHEVFLRQIIGKTDDALRTYYRTQVFTGIGLMPKVLASEGDVLRYVANTRGAIGYVTPDFPVEAVKVLTVLEPRASTSRQLVTRTEPNYPETLERLHIGGIVRLAVTISPKGSVEDVQILGGNPILAEAAVKAVKQWVYTPRAATTTTEVSIPFEPHP